jgi:hypothetical protein
MEKEQRSIVPRRSSIDITRTGEVDVIPAYKHRAIMGDFHLSALLKKSILVIQPALLS